MEKELVVTSTAGLHAQIAAKIVQAASKYSVDVNLYYENKVVDAKSILGLMSLAIPAGKNIKLIARGDQAEDVIKDIEKLLG